MSEVTKSPFTSSMQTSQKSEWKNQISAKQYLKTDTNIDRKYVDFDLMTEKVRGIAVKSDLENLSKAALSEISTGLIETLTEIIEDLIKISR
jgi:hypothetical protein